MNYENYICGTRFRDLADAVLQDNGAVKLTNIQKGNKYSVFYCHTHEFNKAVAKIEMFTTKTVLITHNSDGSVRNSQQGQQIREHDADASLLPPNVVKWYAQNVEASLKDNPKVVPIPIGLENRYCFDYDKAEMLFNKPQRPPSKLYYFNCNLGTNVAERSEALLRCRNLASDNISIRLGMNGQNYDRYLEEILDHKYVISPRGNGLDCHRTYESLYLKRIPIMRKEESIVSFNLPIWSIDNWDELPTQPRWEMNINMNLDSLDMNYWRERISNAK